jgi:protein-S-isoprenylcysteine O-methyltransferase Ste14
MRALRHLLSILILPFTMTVVVPTWILARESTTDTRWPAGSALSWVGGLAGVLALGFGLALFVWCVSLFARVGQGTLAPWDPTRRLVAVGPYRYVRNPMITSVATILLGEALITGSRMLATWCGIFLVINHVHFLLVEEPGLEHRFGDDYCAYKAAVPRWIPRLTPWTGGDR